MLAGMLEPLGQALTPAAAQAILSVRAGDAALARIEELARRCDEGSLTSEERAEYQLFVDVGDLIALLQARARRFLAGQPGA
jgi:hypothetical protein